MKKIRKLIIALIIFSMAAMYGSVPIAGATSSLTQSKDLISTSANSAVSSHTLTFTTLYSWNGTQGLNAADKIQITFPSGFTNINSSNMTCPEGAGFVAGGGASSTVYCTAQSARATGTKSILITGITNPAATGNYTIDILTTNNTGTVIYEESHVKVAILPQVVMTATVTATLNFVVNGTTTGVSINGITTTNVSTPTSTPFGTLVVNTPSIVGQDMSVTTNAANGYIVTVQQDQEMHNTTGDTINSFDNSIDGSGSTTPHVWNNPLATLDMKNTYGHMGLTSNDADLGAGSPNDGYNDYTGSKFVGLNGAAPVVIMAHSGAAAGPADGVTQNKGKASVAYQTVISFLQEAGDYTNTLTYICTPTF